MQAPRKSILRAQGAIFEGTDDPTATFVTYNRSDLAQLNAQPPPDRRESLAPRRSVGNVTKHDDSSDEDENGSMEMEMELPVEEDLSRRRVSFASGVHIR